jgi:RNA polymerase sigma-70 factor, ECF subfamily
LNLADWKFADRESADWESIVRAHGPMAFDTAWRLLGDAGDAEDVVQEALLDAFRLHSRRTVVNWGGLLRHLAACRAIDRLRSRAILRPLTNEPVGAISDQPESAVIERELAAQLRSAIATLSGREAEVLSLRYFGEMTNTAIAEILGISADAVGVALHKARTRLREILSIETVIHRRTLP